MTRFEIRQAKYDWAKSHPGKVREANRRYRRANEAKVRQQTAARMKRLRARRRGTNNVLTSPNQSSSNNHNVTSNLESHGLQKK